MDENTLLALDVDGKVCAIILSMPANVPMLAPLRWKGQQRSYIAPLFSVGK